MTNKTITLAICCMLLSLVSCQKGNKDDIEICAESFCQAFLNFNYTEAYKYCAEEDCKWFLMYVSNIGKKDEDSIRNITERPHFHISDISRNTEDSTATVLVDIQSAHLLDSIGRPPYYIRTGKFRIRMVCRNGAWKVRMADLLQNER